MSYGGNYNGGGGYGQQSGGYGQQGGYNQGGYGQQAANPYGSGNRYEPNRYDSGNPYGGGNQYGGSQPSYGQNNGSYNNQYNQAPAAAPPAQNRYDQGGYGGQQGGYSDNVEMGQMNGNRLEQTKFEKSRDIQKAVRHIMDVDFPALQKIQQDYLGASDPSRIKPSIDKKQGDIDYTMESLKKRLEDLMNETGATPDDRAEMKRTATKLQDLASYSTRVDNEFRKKEKATRERQYKITNPRATQAEINEAVDSMEQEDGQIFAQSLMRADRRGQAATVLGNVRSRHEEIMRIEKSMNELSDLFIQTNELTVRQEEQVNKIEEQAQNVETDVGQANVQLDGAIVKARAARKKKWICLGIVVAIILIIIIIIAIVVAVNHQGQKTVTGN